ncbi:polynucleotide 5 hydroxyl-kinase GRC3 [Fusarium globosum]|uniref:Polynucleotide 5'-hydroxyl-kinase GRC3 n=1 Tax=Fusarium globosum TaxID=78864 RepID=A0A8H6D512_9HYPO|nr:polynucleotide 5 hydroxyl-kinase GRC3 [Fusarium globosum]
MSSHKKRRIEGVDATKPMSAIAALAARRREAAASSTSAQQSPECDEKQPTTNVNYFSLLQKGTSQVGTPSTPKKSAVKTPRSQRLTESPAAHPKSHEMARKMWNESPEGDSTKSNKESTFQIEAFIPGDDQSREAISFNVDMRPEVGRKVYFFAQTLRGVVVMDLDPGQPEYAPAGTLSLVFATKPNLGTPFTHPGIRDAASNVVRCHSMASVTPASDPDLYLACAVDLFDTYNKSFAGVPLIVNTPGWILGTGLDLLCALARMLKPEEVLYMSEDGPSETVDALRAATATTLTELPSQQSEFTSRTAAHLRAMQTMSYFHLQDLASTTTKQTDTTQRLKWNPSPLSFRPPLLVRYSSKKGIFGLVSYDYQCSPELLADTVSGLVLAAVEIEDMKAFSGFIQDQVSADTSSKLLKLDATSKDEALQIVSTSPEGIPFIPNYNDAALDPRYSRTIGLVLLRGIDTKSHTLQLTTPIPAEEFKHIKSQGRDIVLLHGKFDTPSWAYTEDLYERAGTDEGNDTILEVTDEDTDDDRSEAEPEDVDRIGDAIGGCGHLLPLASDR